MERNEDNGHLRPQPPQRGTSISIPFEVLHQILLLLPSKDLESAKFVCTQWYSCALIPRAILFNHGKKCDLRDDSDLDGLLMFSRHEAVRRYPQRLTLSSSWSSNDYDQPQSVGKLHEILKNFNRIITLAIDARMVAEFLPDISGQLPNGVFENLISLKLTFDELSPDYFITTNSRGNAVTLFFDGFPALRRLTIDFPFNANYSTHTRTAHDRLRARAFARLMEWLTLAQLSQLERVELVNCVLINSNDLKPFLTKHKDTLKDLHFSAAVALERQLPSLVRFLGRVMELDQFVYERRDDGPDVVRLHDSLARRQALAGISINLMDLMHAAKFTVVR
nr:hypothetical protein CFP56_43735 [Quercus suber]